MFVVVVMMMLLLLLSGVDGRVVRDSKGSRIADFMVNQKRKITEQKTVNRCSQKNVFFCSWIQILLNYAAADTGQRDWVDV